MAGMSQRESPLLSTLLSAAPNAYVWTHTKITSFADTWPHGPVQTPSSPVFPFSELSVALLQTPSAMEETSNGRSVSSEGNCKPAVLV